MKSRLDATLTVVLVLCALVTTGFVVRRELLFPATTQATTTTRKPEHFKDWRSYLAKGERMGSATAPVQLLEVADFECPACASLHKSLKALRERYPDKVALTFTHYPLPQHRFAEPAVRAVECAGKQARFEAMHDRLFEDQKELGKKPWNEMAREAGVADIGAFETCMGEEGPIPRLTESLKLVKVLDAKGTPTLLVNGWKLGHVPSVEDLDSMVKAVLAGKNPV